MRFWRSYSKCLSTFIRIYLFVCLCVCKHSQGQDFGNNIFCDKKIGKVQMTSFKGQGTWCSVC